MVANTIARVVVMILMTIALIILIVSGVFLATDRGSYNILLLHRFAGVVMVITTVAHFYIRYDKLKKLTVDFLSIIRTGSITRKHTKEIIFNPITKLTLKDLCDLYNINIDEAINILKSYKIKNIQSNNTFEFIAYNIHEDPLKLFETILGRIKANKML